MLVLVLALWEGYAHWVPFSIKLSVLSVWTLNSIPASINATLDLASRASSREAIGFLMSCC